MPPQRFDDRGIARVIRVRADVRAEASLMPLSNVRNAESDADAAEASATHDAAWNYETRCPEDFNQRVMQKLIELGEQAQAEKLQGDPVQFWTSYRDGWAQANSDAHAWYASALEPWELELVDAAKNCVVSKPGDTMFGLFPEQKIPKLVVERSPLLHAIWIRPDIPQDLGPLPVDLDIEWAGMRVDVAPLLKLFDEIKSIEWFEKCCELCMKGVTVVGKWHGHEVELGFRSKPSPPLEYESGPL